jgi:hypothetical protein
MVNEMEEQILDLLVKMNESQQIMEENLISIDGRQKKMENRLESIDDRQQKVEDKLDVPNRIRTSDLQFRKRMKIDNLITLFLSK